VNYYNTFIQVAPDCPVAQARIPKESTVAGIQYELLSRHPYTYTQEEILFEVFVRRQGFSREEVERRRDELWASFFQKSRPCFRASPLPKTHGWGIHFDHQGRAALYAVESKEYQEFVSGQRGDVKLLFAVRSRREPRKL